MIGTSCGAREAESRGQEESAYVRSIALNRTLEALLVKLTEQVALRNGETVEQARRGVEIAVVSRGIEALSKDLSA